MKDAKPLTIAGRQTLVYIIFGGAGPVLTLLVIWAMAAIRYWQGASEIAKLDKFAALANMVSGSLMIIVVALACFVSIRAIKVGPNGLEAESSGSDATATATVTTGAVTASVTVPTTQVDATTSDNAHVQESANG